MGPAKLLHTYVLTYGRTYGTARHHIPSLAYRRTAGITSFTIHVMHLIEIAFNIANITHVDDSRVSKAISGVCV